MDHKDLNVWKESMKLVKEVYLLLKTFPSYEQYGISAQMRRSAVSIPSNIAEGAGRNNDKENLRFCHYSHGSLAELETQLLLSAELGYIKKDNSVFKQITTVRKLLSGYIHHLQTKLDVTTKQTTPDIKKNHLERNHIFGKVKSLETETFNLQRDSLSVKDTADMERLLAVCDSARFRVVDCSKSKQQYSSDGWLLEFVKYSLHNADCL